MSVFTSPRRGPAGPSAPVPAAPDLVSPPASRHRRRQWRDPRLVVGLVIVLGSVLLGARLLGGADDTVPVYRATGQLAAGQRLGSGDVTEASVRFASPQDADRYVETSDELPEGAVLLRDVGAGELLPRSVLGAPGSATLTEVPLAVAADAVPDAVGRGSVVDVWVTPPEGADGRTGQAVLVLDDVPVLSAPVTATALGPETTRQVVVGVDESSTRLAPVLARITAGAVVVTGQAAG